MSSYTFRRTLVGAVAIAGALGLAACNNSDTASVTTPTGGVQTSTSTTTTPSTTTQESSPETSTTTTTEDTPEVSTTSQSPSTSETKTTKDDGGSTKVTPDGTKLKYGEGAVIKDDTDGKFRLKVKSLKAAPSSAYAAANLNKSNGKMYYVDYDVTYLGGAKYGFHPTSVNFLELRPVFDSSQKGRAGGAPYDDLPGCKKSSYDDMKVGDTASACYYYQITGSTPSKVMWDDYTTQIVWSK